MIMHISHFITSLYLVTSPLFTYAQNSQNETFIAQEIAKIPTCGVRQTLSNLTGFQIHLYDSSSACR